MRAFIRASANYPMRKGLRYAVLLFGVTTCAALLARFLFGVDFYLTFAIAGALLVATGALR